MEVDFSASLDPEANVVITNRKDLERTGIFEDLEYRIKKDLKIEDELEYAYHNWDKLNKLDKGHINILLHTEKNLKTHPYYTLLIENIKQE